MKIKLNAQEIAQRIKNLMKETNIRQKDLCEITGISRNTVTNYTAGERIPDTTNIYAIAKALNVTIEHILTGEEHNCGTHLTDEEKNILKMYNELSEKNKGKIELLLEQKLEEQQQQKSYGYSNKNVV